MAPVPLMVMASAWAVVVTALVPPTASAAHCIPRPSAVADSLPRFHNVLNGQPVGSLPRDLKYELIETICWDKAERMFGVRVSQAVVSAWTAPSPLTLLKHDLRRLVEHERVHRERYGAYTHVEDLQGFVSSDRIAVEVTVLAEGVIATGFHDQLDYLCYVFWGNTEPPRPDMTAGEPLCESQHGKGPWGTRR